MLYKKEAWKDELYGDAVREKILEFAERGWDEIPDDEREAWFSGYTFRGVFHQRDDSNVTTRGDLRENDRQESSLVNLGCDVDVVTRCERSAHDSNGGWRS